MHLFLSPHFDDAVYSCGGTIYQLVQSGQTVRVYTVMGGTPPEKLPDTPIVRDLHQRWQSGENPVLVRRLEDEAALHGLDAEAAYNSLIADCIYRVSLTGEALYATEAAIFGSVHPTDPAVTHLTVKIASAGSLWQPITFDEITGITRFVKDEQDAVTVYAPLSVGNHVDHQIVRDWALDLKQQYPYLRLKFYEDFPYIRQVETIPAALAGLRVPLTKETVHLTKDAVQAKMRAVAAYRTQISSFWTDEAALTADVDAVLRRTGQGTPAEGYYSLQ